MSLHVIPHFRSTLLDRSYSFEHMVEATLSGVRLSNLVHGQPGRMEMMTDSFLL